MSLSLSLSPQQIHKDIRSLLNDQQRCVSVSHAMRLGVSRFQLASLLQSFAEDPSPPPKITMRCDTFTDKTENGIGVTVFKMRKCKNNGGPDNPPISSTRSVVYAISQLESLAAAHERYLADLRDRTKDRRLVAKDPDGILPNPHYISSIVANSPPALAAADPAAPQSILLQGPRKPTTALNFFSKQQTKGKENTNQTTAAAPTTSEKEVPPATIAAAAETARLKKSGNRNGQAKNHNKVSSSKTVSKSSAGAKKQGSSNTTKDAVGVAPVAVGTVDDFHGDMDDTDDDSSVEVTNKKTPKPPVPKPPEKTTHDVNLHRSPKSKPNPTGPPAKRRRKVQKTRCTQDDKGYMVTEYYEEWEDVPSDEEMPPILVTKKTPPPPPTKKAPASKKGKKPTMKQGSLTSFFKKG